MGGALNEARMQNVIFEAGEGQQSTISGHFFLSKFVVSHVFHLFLNGGIERTCVPCFPPDPCLVESSATTVVQFLHFFDMV